MIIKLVSINYVNCLDFKNSGIYLLENLETTSENENLYYIYIGKVKNSDFAF